MQKYSSLLRQLAFVLSLSFALTACMGSGGGEDAGMEPDLAGDNGPTGLPVNPHNPDQKPQSGCDRSNPDNICVGLKYVVYKDSTGQATLSQSEVNELVKGVNAIWATCKISFAVDQYLAANPADYQLNYQPSTMGELTSIRNAFQPDRSFLVVSTGTWNRAGGIYANAWTSMPGSYPYGVVIERPVNSNINMIAHELGHYLSLDHVQNSSYMMNPTIYASSQYISASECQAARDTAVGYWTKMLR